MAKVEKYDHREDYIGREVGTWEFPFKYQGRRFKLVIGALAVDDDAEKLAACNHARILLRSLAK